MRTGSQKAVLYCVLLALGFFVSLTAVLAVAQDNSNKVVRESILSNKKKRSYYLFVPATVKSPAPLIVLLHGSGRNGLSLVDRWRDLAAKEGFIIVGPDADSGGGWSQPRDGPDFLHDLVEALKAKYTIDPRRVYLFGHSAGAVFALIMSTVESEYFAATAIHAGAFRTPEEYETISKATRKIPLAIWVGTVDPFFHLADVRATRDAFRSAGFTIEVTEMPGHDHWYYDLAPGINQSAWQFLKTHELSSDPRYSEYTGPGAAGDANKVIREINTQNTRVRELVDQYNEKERDLGRKDFAADRPEVIKLAQTQIALLEEGAMLFRSAADKAEAASQLKLPTKQKEYLGLIARYNLKWADVIDAMRERSEALLSTESRDVIEARRNEAQTRADKLHQEADDVQKAIDKLMH